MKFMSPRGTFAAFAASERSHWGSELDGRYISVQEHKSRRLRLSRWFIPPTQSPAEESCQFLWHHFRVTSVHSVGKKGKKKSRDSCLHIQLSVFLCWEWGSKLGLLPRCSIGREDGVDMKSFSRRDALGDKRLWGTLASNPGCRWEVEAEQFHEEKQHFVLCLKDVATLLRMDGRKTTFWGESLCWIWEFPIYGRKNKIVNVTICEAHPDQQTQIITGAALISLRLKLPVWGEQSGPGGEWGWKSISIPYRSLYNN